jgi:hypothetical protein
MPTMLAVALHRIAPQAVDLVRFGAWSVWSQRLGSAPYRTGSWSLHELGHQWGNVAKAVATECGPQQAHNDESPAVAGLSRCAEEDSNLHPVIPDQALNPTQGMPIGSKPR